MLLGVNVGWAWNSYSKSLSPDRMTTSMSHASWCFTLGEGKVNIFEAQIRSQLTLSTTINRPITIPLACVSCTHVLPQKLNKKPFPQNIRLAVGISQCTTGKKWTLSSNTVNQSICLKCALGNSINRLRKEAYNSRMWHLNAYKRG